MGSAGRPAVGKGQRPLGTCRPVVAFLSCPPSVSQCTAAWGLRRAVPPPRLLSQASFWLPAPRPALAKASTPRAVGPLFIDRPDFFDYPDSDRDSLLAVAQFIGEKPVVFVPSGRSHLVE